MILKDDLIDQTTITIDYMRVESETPDIEIYKLNPENFYMDSTEVYEKEDGRIV